MSKQYAVILPLQSLRGVAVGPLSLSQALRLEASIAQLLTDKPIIAELQSPQQAGLPELASLSPLPPVERVYNGDVKDEGLERVFSALEEVWNRR